MANDINVGVKVDATSALGKLRDLDKQAKYTDSTFKQIKETFESFGKSAISLDNQRQKAFQTNLDSMKKGLESFTSAAKSLDEQRSTSFKSNLAKMRRDLESFASAAKSLNNQRTSVILSEHKKWSDSRKKLTDELERESTKSFNANLKSILAEGKARYQADRKATDSRLKSINEQLKARQKQVETEYKLSLSAQRSLENILRQSAERQKAIERAKYRYIRTEATSALESIASRGRQQLRSIDNAASFPKLEDALKRIGLAADGSITNMKNFATAITTAAVGLGRFINESVLLNSTFMGFRNSLATVSGQQSIANEEMRYAVSLSRKYALDIKNLTKQYSKFSISARLAGMSNEEVRGTFESVAKAMRVLNLTAPQQDRVFLALEQMASKTTVQMEELKRQLGDVLPGAVQLGAKAMGYGAGEMQGFFDAVRAGTVKSAEFLPKFSKELNKLYGPQVQASLEKYSAKVQALSNEWTLFRANVGHMFDPLAAWSVEEVKSLVAAANEVFSFFRGSEGLHLVSKEEIDNLGQWQENVWKAGEEGERTLNKLKSEQIDIDKYLPDYKDATTGLMEYGKSSGQLLRKLRNLRSLKGLDIDSWFDQAALKNIATELGYTEEQFKRLGNKELYKGMIEWAEDELPKAEAEFKSMQAQAEIWQGTLSNLGDAGEEAKKASEDHALSIENLKNYYGDYVKNLPLTEIQQEISLIGKSGQEKERLSFIQRRFNDLAKEQNKLLKDGKEMSPDVVMAYNRQTFAMADAKDKLYELNEEKAKAEEISKNYKSALEKEADQLLTSSQKFEQFADKLKSLIPKDTGKGAKIASYELSKLASEFRELTKPGNIDVEGAKKKMEEFEEAAKSFFKQDNASYDQMYAKQIVEQMSAASQTFADILKEKGDEIKLAIATPTEAEAMKAAKDTAALVQKFLNDSTISFSTLLEAETVKMPDGTEVSYSSILGDNTWYHTVKVKYETVNAPPAGVSGNRGSSTVNVNTQQAVGTRRSGA